MEPKSYGRVSGSYCDSEGLMRTYRCPNDTRMALDPVLVASAEECEAAHSSGGKELNSENGVDLANELVADIDSSFSYRAAKLYVMSVVCRLSYMRIILSYLEVIGKVVFAIAGRTKKTLCLIARS